MKIATNLKYKNKTSVSTETYYQLSINSDSYLKDSFPFMYRYNNGYKYDHGYIYILFKI